MFHKYVLSQRLCEVGRSFLARLTEYVDPLLLPSRSFRFCKLCVSLVRLCDLFMSHTGPSHHSNIIPLLTAFSTRNAPRRSLEAY